MDDVGTITLSTAHNRACGALFNQHEGPPPLLITDGMDPRISTEEMASLKSTVGTPIRECRPRGDDAGAGESGSRPPAPRPRAPLFRQR